MCLSTQVDETCWIYWSSLWNFISMKSFLSRLHPLADTDRSTDRLTDWYTVSISTSSISNMTHNVYLVGGIAQSVDCLRYGMAVRRVVIRFSAGARDFSFLYSVQIGCRAYRASYSVRTGVTISGAKRPDLEADHRLPVVPRLGILRAIPLLRHMPLWGSHG